VFAAASTGATSRASILSVRFNHDGKYLAISMEDTNLSIVDTETGETVVSMTLQKQLDYLCWHPRKNELAYVGDRPSSEKNNNRDGVIKAIVLKEPVM
jgi:WD40 repeat protein